MPKQTRIHSEAHPAEWSDPLRPQKPLISGKWLLSAISITLVIAVICAYATLCLLFYQGSWQFLFHPSHTVSAGPNVPYQSIQFDDTETGQLQLTGWWIPADANARYTSNTILYLHDGRGSLPDSSSQLESLHALGINVFAFDYRGFGKSAGIHPSEISMNQDADAALAYLTGTRHLSAHSIIIFGTGLGATIAVAAAARHPEVAALVLENISPNALAIFAADRRTKILPVRLLTSDRFDPAETLRTLETPKLFIERGHDQRTHNLFSVADMPKQFFQIAPNGQTQYRETVRDFLSQTIE